MITKTLMLIAELTMTLTKQGVPDPAGLAYDVVTGKLAQLTGCSCAGWANLEPHQRRLDGHHEQCPQETPHPTEQPPGVVRADRI